jgi:hypothetical protein
MTRWYRRYSGTVSDPKLAEVALVVGCSKAVVIATWDAILESACEAEKDGQFTATARRIAAILSEPVNVIEAVMAEMVALGMIADASICNWSRRQFTSDSSTERSRKFRAKRQCNGDETLQGRCATPPDTETHTDSENISLPSEQEAARESEGVSRFDLVGVRVGAEAFEITTDAKRAVCAALQIGNAEPIVRAYRLWPGSRRARSVDAQFRSSAPKIYRNLSPTDRAECQPLAPPEPEIMITPARPSSQLSALLKNGRHAH